MEESQFGHPMARSFFITSLHVQTSPAETLAERVAKGPVPVEEALEIIEVEGQPAVVEPGNNCLGARRGVPQRRYDH